MSQSGSLDNKRQAAETEQDRNMDRWEAKPMVVACKKSDKHPIPNSL
jgi:hypothetical protein